MKKEKKRRQSSVVHLILYIYNPTCLQNAAIFHFRSNIFFRHFFFLSFVCWSYYGVDIFRFIARFSLITFSSSPRCPGTLYSHWSFLPFLFFLRYSFSPALIIPRIYRIYFFIDLCVSKFVRQVGIFRHRCKDLLNRNAYERLIFPFFLLDEYCVPAIHQKGGSRLTRYIVSRGTKSQLISLFACVRFIRIERLDTEYD